MQEYTTTLPPKTIQLLRNVETMEMPILETFLEEVSLILARRKAANFSKEEAVLMEKINHGISQATRDRQKELSLKNRYETISETEREELLSISTQIEMNDLVRIQSISELAQIQQITVDELMHKLGLKFSNNLS